MTDRLGHAMIPPTMAAKTRTLPLLTNLLFVIAMLFAPTGYAQPAGASCVMARATDCPPCCAAMTCCLLSKNAAPAPAHPEPLRSENSRQLDHALAPATFTLLPSTDFLAPPQERSALVDYRASVPPRSWTPRAAVSCIWLI